MMKRSIHHEKRITTYSHLTQKLKIQQEKPTELKVDIDNSSLKMISILPMMHRTYRKLANIKDQKNT